VKTPQPAKAVGAHSYSFQIRQYDASCVANNHVLDISIAIDEHPYLSVNLMRCFRELTRKLVSNDLPRGDPPLVQLLETVDLVRLESL
jgi:hypothetical protein